MGGKKKGGKKGKKKEKKGPAKLVVPNFVPIHRPELPMAVKVHHYDENFLIYTDSYDESIKILEQIGLILKREIDTMRLYFPNKRLVEINTVNYDQKIIHNTELYLQLKNEEQWENIKDIIAYNIYDVDVDSILQKKEEEKQEALRKKKEEEEKKKK